MRSNIVTSPIEVADVGDLVQCSWKEEDVTVSTHGRIAHIVADGRVRVLKSETSKTIARYSLDKLRAVTCVILERYTPLPPQLF